MFACTDFPHGPRLSLYSLSSLSFLYSHFPIFHGTSPAFPRLPSPSPMLLLLSSLSCVQIDQPEFDILLQKEQEQKIYAQVRFHTTHPLCPQAKGCFWLLRRSLPCLLDPAGTADLPESPGNFAGRRCPESATACCLVHLLYFTPLPVSEAARAAAGPRQALPSGHYWWTAGA